MSDILAEGVQGAEALRSAAAWPLMFQWHDKHYLGAIHGLAGIVTVLLQAHQLLGDAAWPAPQHLAALRGAAHALARSRLPSGNLPSSLGNDSDRWAGRVQAFAHCTSRYMHGGPSLLSSCALMCTVVWRARAGWCKCATVRQAFCCCWRSAGPCLGLSKRWRRPQPRRQTLCGVGAC